VRRSWQIGLGSVLLLAWLQGCGGDDTTTGSTAASGDVGATSADATTDSTPTNADTTTDSTPAASAGTANTDSIPASGDTSGGDTTGGETTSGDTSSSDASDAVACAIEDFGFEYQVIDDSGPVDIWQKIVGDLNGDGRVDLIAGGQAGGGLVWYESPDWERHEIAPGGGHSTDGEIADVDGDGDGDVVSVTRSSLVWYDNPSWTSHEIDNRVLHDVEVADFDGDGDVDAVARNQGEFGGSGDELHFYTQESPTTWTHRAVSIPDGEGLLVTDLDGDGDPDVVIAGRWYENTGDIADGPWTEHVYTSSWSHPNAYIAAADFNGDGRLDVVLAPAELAGQTGRIAWYAAPDDPTSGDWAEQVIETDVEAVHHFVGAADFDNDGQVDVAAAEMQQGADPDEVKIFVNGGEGTSWNKVVLATSGSHSMRVVDANGDGFADLYGANHRGTDVELWLNPGCAP
jgi:FG-GAP-like repeat